MTDGKLPWKRAGLIFLGFVATCVVHANAVATLPLPYELRSLMATTSGLVTGFAAVRLFIGWMESDPTDCT